MIRNVVHIDEDKCDGCGQCVSACAEGAIEIVDGKARLVSDAYCDGLGACLGECPQGAITVEEREAGAFDEEAVKARLHKNRPAPALAQAPAGFVCPGAMARSLTPAQAAPARANGAAARPAAASGLRNWPIQLSLVTPFAPFLQGADLLLVADCVPFAMSDFHARFLNGGPVVIGCPKLDDVSRYVDKLADILKTCSIRSLKTIHMEVPCCSGITRIAEAAIAAAGVEVPFDDVTISISGEVAATRRAVALAAVAP